MCRASTTTPMPPSPMTRSTRYLPARMVPCATGGALSSMAAAFVTASLSELGDEDVDGPDSRDRPEAEVRVPGELAAEEGEPVIVNGHRVDAAALRDGPHHR